jgi:membrane-bound lytic murein transglycosylase B
MPIIFLLFLTLASNICLAAPSDFLKKREFATRFAENYILDVKKVRKTILAAKYQKEIIKKISRPAESKPWYEYQKIFLTDDRIKAGVEFLHQHKQVLKKANKRFSVPAEIITAIIGVETYYGTHLGKYRVIDALVTLSFHYPKRSKFFREQLQQYLLMTNEEKINPLSLKGSYAGAMGLGQFTPGSYRKFAIDMNRDKKRDLFNEADAIGSIANYLKKHRWKKGQPIAFPVELKKPVANKYLQDKKPRRNISQLRELGVDIPVYIPDSRKAMLLPLKIASGNEYWLAYQNFYVITRYNHSPLYAMAVFLLAENIRMNYEDLYGDFYGT